MLTARAVEPSPLLTAPFPGERDIDTSKGLVKIGGDITLPSGTPQTRFAIARVTFRINEQAQTSALSFHDFSIGGFGKTSIQGNEILTGSNEKDGNTLLAPPPCIGNILGCQEGGETSVKLPLLRIQPPSLVINTGTPTGAANITINLTHTAPTLEEKTKIALSNDSALAPPVDAARLTRPDTVIAATVPNTLTSSSNTSLSSSAQQGQTPAAPNALFPLLQIQNLRVTTQGRNLLVAWQPLGSSALKGYNVYYGTVSGQYIQRRSIPISPPSLTIRDLEPNTQYFVAVRGFAEGNTETAFTQEASVIIGKPETASSPLITSGEDLTSPENPLEVRERTIISGESGPTSTLLLFLFLSACIGTALAARRSSFYE
jgi:hypothetical protein